MEVLIDYAPRPLQTVIHDGMVGHRFGAVVCHRRFGKTVCAINHLQRAALTCPRPRPRFGYLAPTYTQGKSIAWDYFKHYAREIPGHSVNESELRIDYPNGGQVRIYGADNPDSLRGLYFDGVVLDEYGLMPPRIYTEVIRPTLADRQGWALFIGTPAGQNHFYQVVQEAKATPDWFYGCYKASETGLLTTAELASARVAMTVDEYQQEFECSFEASVKGAIFARELLAAREDGRITRVPYDPTIPVDTDWDLGMGDATAVWFSQSLRSREIRLIDYYEANGFGLDHYKRVLDDKPYTYGQHWAPHDIEVRELGSGNSRLQAARDMGLNFRVLPRIDHLEDGIHAARMVFPRCWFDADKTAKGMEMLQNYRWKQSRVTDPTGKPLPVHDFASHASDAFRGLAYRHYVDTKRPEAVRAAETRKAQRDEAEPFRWSYGVRRSRAGY